LIKRILFGSPLKECPIVLQAVNGPCPLLAICNVLFLRGKLTVPATLKEIKFEQLCDLLKGYLDQKMEEDLKKSAAASSPTSKQKGEAVLANVLKNIEDTMRIFPKLEKGLDINVIFSRPQGFEFTPEIALFDLFDVKLVHGWVYDPQESKVATAMGNMSYNETMDFLTKEHQEGDLKGIELKNVPMKKEIIKGWLDASKAQLTVYGLSEMHQALKEGELAILFRNNHFAVLYKFQGELYCLVTDAEVVFSAPQVVWNRLNDVQGDDEFLDCEFRVPSARKKPPEPAGLPPVAPPASSSAIPIGSSGRPIMAHPSQAYGSSGGRPSGSSAPMGIPVDSGYPYAPAAKPPPFAPEYGPVYGPGGPSYGPGSGPAYGRRQAPPDDDDACIIL
jgi:hypothetical protein